MNKHKLYRSDFHKWIIDEWVNMGAPKTWIKGESYPSLHWCIRLWSHECGKHYVADDIGGTGKR
jgi:hypothetical protein